MKKTSTLFSLGLLLTGAAFAQPVINSTVTYTVGGQLESTNFNGQGFVAGNGGPGQTWDFSTLQSTGAGTSVVVDVASSPYGSSYPTATTCIKTGNLYAYSLINSSGVSTLGAYNGQANIPYSDPEKTFKFPFAYQDVLTDNWQASFTTQGISTVRYGTTKVTYDGYGTLTTPAGTFTDVARFKMEQDYYDVMNGDTIHYKQDGYSWVKDGSRSLLATGKLTFNAFGLTQTTYFGSYTPGDITLGVAEPEAMETLSIYPNPSSGPVTIESEGLSFVNLLNLEGKIVKGFPVSSNRVELSLDLPAGMYMAECIYKDGHRAVRRLLMN